MEGRGAKVVAGAQQIALKKWHPILEAECYKHGQPLEKIS